MYLLFAFSMACLYVGEVVFVAYMGIKEGVDQGVVALVLIFITLLWHWTVSSIVILLIKAYWYHSAKPVIVAY